jgi:3-isopropylmalate/(R)-2-methylmalate dehydratase small subunit
LQPLRTHSGIVAPLDKVDVDTDQIIPKQFLKRIERTGFGEFLFNDWRYQANGTPEPGFVLNEPRYAGASILVTGRNFGCGSSREHAVWALLDYGFRVVIAPSFADIFATNCTKNGVVVVALSAAEVSELIKRAREIDGYRLDVDLEAGTVSDGHGFAAKFEMEVSRRNCLINGLDDIGLTMAHEAEISAYENSRRLVAGFQR